MPFHSMCRMNYYSRLCDFAFIAICLSFLHLATELIKGRFIRKTLEVVRLSSVKHLKYFLSKGICDETTPLRVPGEVPCSAYYRQKCCQQFLHVL